MPGFPNQTADTVAELVALHRVESAWLHLLEFQTEPDPEMFGRLLCELGKFWLEHRPNGLPSSRYQLVASVVNLTGTTQSLPASLAFEFPIDKLGLSLAVKERHLATKDAGVTLEKIATGTTTMSILAFVPLMTGGGEASIIQRWLELAGAVPDRRRRNELGQLALVVAELKAWFGKWQKALEGWDMRESTVIQGWIDQGKLQTLRQTLGSLLKKRFGKVPAKVLRRIEAATDSDKLEKAVVDIFDIARPEDLTL